MHDAGPPSPITIRPIPASATRPLRHRVLRPHQTPAEMVYEGDDRPDTLHLGAFEGVSQPGQPAEPVGIVSLYRTRGPVDGRVDDWQLRGMAVAPKMRGLGIGGRLIRASIDAVHQRGGRRIWCNARITAEGFYSRLGFATHGEPFEIAGIGTHVVMSIKVS